MKRWLCAVLLVAACGAHAQPYPSKPIRIVIPFPPGNTTDIMSRLIAPKMAERLGQQVIVENRPGASGMLGLDYVARSPADGYTIACVQGGNMVVLPHTSKNIPYDPLKDFAPISVTTFNYLAIVANPDAPFKTIGEMVRYAKANPGKLTVATNGESAFESARCSAASDSGVSDVTFLSSSATNGHSVTAQSGDRADWADVAITTISVSSVR